tara:strand:+ start:1506 stop:2177 length:672 start_codon:yes stop_codon:yes gene_type:complete
MKYFKGLPLEWDVDKLQKSLQEVVDIVPFPSAGKVINHYSKTFSDFINPVRVIDYRIEEEIQSLDTVVNQIVLTKRPEATSDYFRVKLRDQKKGEIITTNTRERVGEEDDYSSEMDYSDFIPEFNHTYFKEIYDYFNSLVNVGRIRLIKSFPQQCLSWHADNDDKIHIPIKTNIGVRMIVEDEVIHMSAGSTTIMRTNKNKHSAMNGGDAERVHLVIPFKDKT